MRLRIRRSPEALREVSDDLVAPVQPSPRTNPVFVSLSAKGMFYAGPVQRISGRGSFGAHISMGSESPRECWVNNSGRLRRLGYQLPFSFAPEVLFSLRDCQVPEIYGIYTVQVC